MGASAFDHDFQAVGSSIEGTDLDFCHAGGKFRNNMETEHQIDMRIFETASLDHGFSTAGSLFCGLEKKFHRSGEILPVSCKQFRYAERHCHMSIVAAGMHVAMVERSIGPIGRLLYR
ncbi:MAG: hypothetical protein BWY89_02044 [Bacteroidetes bacterium ADurb.BinA012]|nr:MAG: hypothetical protein BWY89_02044 [Bacteroidetes bacterium ADurb.BinA012]